MKVLDLGAGDCPYEGTTAAMDEMDRATLGRLAKGRIRNDANPSCARRFFNLAKSGAYVFGFDYTHAPLPYPSEQFDVVRSSHSLGASNRDQGMHAWREAHRVLKKGGWLVVRLGDRKWATRAKKKMAALGMRVTEKEIIYNPRDPAMSEWEITGVKR